MSISECWKPLLSALLLMVVLPSSAETVTKEGCSSLLVGERSTEIEGPQVSVVGAVAEPGRYAIERGWRVSDLLEAAGGMTDGAYPLGAKLLRPYPRRADAAAVREGNAFLDAAASLLQLSTSSATSGCLSELSSVPTAAMRFSDHPVAVDPVARMQDPAGDIGLADGDVLLIPDRPGHVLVVGAVQMPGRVSFQMGATALDYIKKAGGWAGKAQIGQVKVVLPNGEPRSLSVGLWNYQPEYVPPGSIIVIPAAGEAIASTLREAVGELIGPVRRERPASSAAQP